MNTTQLRNNQTKLGNDSVRKTRNKHSRLDDKTGLDSAKLKPENQNQLNDSVESNQHNAAKQELDSNKTEQLLE